MRLINADALAEKIKDCKSKQQSSNTDYYTGYMSAMSTVEGIIADMEGVCPTHDLLGLNDNSYSDNSEKVNKDKIGAWIPLGHIMGDLNHPYSEYFKCPFCEYKAYTVFSFPPSECSCCGANLTI